MDTWAVRHGIKLDFIRPGKPVENGFIESFKGRLRDECLNVIVFFSVSDAHEKLQRWSRDYNAVRPHSSLDGSAPEEFLDRYDRAKALPFAFHFADKAGRSDGQGDPAGAACGHDLDNRSVLPPSPYTNSKGRARKKPMLGPRRSNWPTADHAGTTEFRVSKKARNSSYEWTSIGGKVTG